MKYIGGILLGVLLASVIVIGSYNKTGGSPQKALDRYFSADIRQDYAAVYNCYYAAYKAKIGKLEYIRHRKEDASVLKSYKILSMRQDGGTAFAQVQLTFTPAVKAVNVKRTEINTTEALVREKGQWKIKVWG